jgi:hypothetical protein
MAMDEPGEKSGSKWKRRARYIGRRYPLAIFAFAAAYSYLTDCFVAHKSHPDIPWIESGVYCPGPFGFIATVVIVVVGIGYCVKKNL